MISRRALIPRLALLATGGAAVWLLRDRLPWPGPRVAFADGRQTGWLPLAGRGGLIEIDVTVGGAPVRGVIDSGAQFSAVDRTLAERLALPRTGALPLLAYGVSGDPTLTHTVKLDLALPGLTAPGLRAAVLDIGGLSAATGRDFSLLIGRDVLSRLVVEPDFPRDRVRLLAPGVYRPPRDAIIVPLRFRRGAPVTPVRIEAAAPVEVMVDTGATGVLALSADAARRAGLLTPGRAISSARSVTLGGLGTDRMVTARTVQVAGLTLHGVDVQIYAPSSQAPVPAGLLGAGLMRRFRMTLDLGEDRLVLVRPTPVLIARPQEQNR